MGQAVPVCGSEVKQNVDVIATAATTTTTAAAATTTAAAAATITTTTTTTTTTGVSYINVLLFTQGYLRTLSINLHHNGIER
jgi:hypothetical protein